MVNIQLNALYLLEIKHINKEFGRKSIELMTDWGINSNAVLDKNDDCLDQILVDCRQTQRASCGTA